MLFGGFKVLLAFFSYKPNCVDLIDQGRYADAYQYITSKNNAFTIDFSRINLSFWKARNIRMPGIKPPKNPNKLSTIPLSPKICPNCGARMPQISHETTEGKFVADTLNNDSSLT